jgi:hypothetical protein
MACPARAIKIDSRVIIVHSISHFLTMVFPFFFKKKMLGTKLRDSKAR